MSAQEARFLASFINAESDRYEALFVAMGPVNMVVLRDRENNTLSTPVVSVAEYLDLVREGSPLVESSPELRRLLMRWSHRGRYFHANLANTEPV